MGGGDFGGFGWGVLASPPVCRGHGGGSWQSPGETLDPGRVLSGAGAGSGRHPLPPAAAFPQCHLPGLGHVSLAGGHGAPAASQEAMAPQGPSSVPAASPAPMSGCRGGWAVPGPRVPLPGSFPSHIRRCRSREPWRGRGG